MDEVERRRAAVRVLIAQEPVGQTDPGVAGWLQRLCHVAVREVPAAGAGITVMSGNSIGGVAAASDPACRALEELQFALGEGPAVDAHTGRRPVLEADVRVGGSRRWPEFATTAHAAGLLSVFAFPLQVGAARLGVLDLYRQHAGPLSVESTTRALTFAEVALEQILRGQARAAHGHAAQGLAEALGYRHVVYQAQGMVMAQLGGSLVDAMARLQAHAYSTDRPLTDVAHDIVQGWLRLEPDST